MTAGSVSFMGLHDCFKVWNRTHLGQAKPFYLPGEDFDGSTAQRPLMLFLDDNAYDPDNQGEDGRLNPYIVTPYRKEADGTYKALTQGIVAEIINPERSSKFTDPQFYTDLILRELLAQKNFRRKKMSSSL